MRSDTLPKGTQPALERRRATVRMTDVADWRGTGALADCCHAH